MVRWIFLFLLFVSWIPATAQSDTTTYRRPTVGVVLSGGGAKGLAHLGFLKVLEEAGIRPDYITGASMGSIVGLLYSMGYSADEITTMSQAIDWDHVLTNRIPLNRVAFEEKPYYGRYITELSIRDKRIRLPTGLVEGQRLHLLLSRIAYPVQDIECFGDFPIPYACVATDIEHGEVVVLDSGDIVKSIRASMAIPAVFTPVEINGKLLVDGGVLRNFPVQEARNMGADIVIGSYVGGQFRDRDDLNSLRDFALQVAFLPSVNDFIEQSEQADFVILPEDSLFSTFDFDKADSILAMGYRNSLAMKEDLIRLADSLGIRQDSLEFRQPEPRGPMVFDSIEVVGNNRLSRKFILGKLQIQKGEPCSVDRLEKRINIAFGTQYFQRITYTVDNVKGVGRILRLEVLEEPASKIRFALHYDTETNVGLTLNYTARNLFLTGERLIAELDFSDNPRLNFDYFKYLGQRQSLAINVGGGSVTQNEFVSDFFGTESVYQGSTVDAYLGLVTTASPNYALGVNLNLDYTFFRPVLRPDTILENYRDQSLNLQAYFSVNTLNRPFFPSRGWYVRLAYNYKLALSSEFRLRSSPAFLNQEFRDLFEFEDFDRYHNIEFTAQRILPVHRRLSLIVEGDLRLHTADTILLGDYYQLGGITPILPRAVPFWGEDVFAYSVRNYSLVRAGLQYEPFKRFFVQAMINYANPNEPFSTLWSSFVSEPLLRNESAFDDVLGLGVKLNYMTFLGPISFGLHQSNRSPTLFTYFGVGFKY